MSEPDSKSTERRQAAALKARSSYMGWKQLQRVLLWLDHLRVSDAGICGQQFGNVWDEEHVVGVVSKGGMGLMSCAM